MHYGIGDHPLWTEPQTEIITFPHAMYVGGKNWVISQMYIECLHTKNTLEFFLFESFGDFSEFSEKEKFYIFHSGFITFLQSY